MYKKAFRFVPVFACLFLVFSNCQVSKRVGLKPIPTEQAHSNTRTMAPILVYKTKKDYSKNVPVILNSFKTEILSYPHPSDVYFQGKLAYPTPLKNGYLLDNRGIGSNVAFLNFSYETYSRLKNAPTKEELLRNLLDKNPLLEMWECGSRESELDVSEINKLIDQGFPGCKQLVKVYQVTIGE